MTALVQTTWKCQIKEHLADISSLLAAANIVYLSHTFVDIKVEFPAHIETDPLPVARLIVYIDEGDFDGIRALWVERHPVRSAVFGVS